MKDDPFPRYDIRVTQACFPRHLKSKKKRIRDKWLKKYGQQTVYTNCVVKGLEEIRVKDTIIYGRFFGLHARRMQVEKKSEGDK